MNREIMKKMMNSSNVIAMKKKLKAMRSMIKESNRKMMFSNKKCKKSRMIYKMKFLVLFTRKIRLASEKSI